MFAYRAPDLISGYNLHPDKTYIDRCEGRWMGVVFLDRRML